MGLAGTLTRGDRLEIMTIVQGQIEDIYRELNLQIKRVAQMQAQVDELCANVRRLLGETDMPSGG